MMSLMVEGGNRINGSFLAERAIDKFYFFFSSKWIGDEKAPGIFGGHGVKDLKNALKLSDLRFRRMGEDFLFEGYVERGAFRVYGNDRR